MISDGQKTFAILEDRGVVSLRGGDARAFLQGLVTNDVDEVTPERAIWTALLTPQGKYLFDFFVVEVMGALVLDCERARIPDLIRSMTRYKLRSRVEITDDSEDWAVAVLVGTEADSQALVGSEGRAGTFAGGVCYVDPRYGGAGARAILPRDAVAQLDAFGFERADAADYDIHRLICGLPDGSRDLIVEKSLPMENGFDPLHAIAWDKGCYVGQELTARMRYRATAKRTLLPVEIEGAAPAPGTPILQGGKDAGEMRSARGGIGLALLRIDALNTLQQDGATLTAGDTRLTPMRPPWLSVDSGEVERPN
ncbi:MAG: folate-binding protein YgfZ [Alphaproteobacteria bacterium]